MLSSDRYPCACGCGKPRGEYSVEGVRLECTRRLLRELRGLQGLAPVNLLTVCSMLQDMGAVKCANFVVGSLPFTDEDGA